MQVLLLVWHGKAIVVAFTCISYGLPAAFQCSDICSVEFYCLALFVWPFAIGRPRWTAVVSMQLMRAPSHVLVLLLCSAFGASL